eukprot:CAMPEP_0174969552 /NCGR_PEP_ID=MMETSP0004_2-20121128/8832_1 /TAXON_ID=420556 /ORGANISM="Ochromonas sp., Strain CCMP1393" /LENGTH=78 /DNA_ID=CAMNT_0016219067 /DNA_START=252 /DNA_END=488 /DNA_ORIENTATION=-
MRKGFSTSASKPSYREKSFSEIWLSDSGAYPVMGVIAFGFVFPIAYMGYQTATHPDARVSKGSRKTLFRGALKGTPLE